MKAIVHILHGGLPLCDFSRVIPSLWPEEHVWTWLKDSKHATCKECLEVYEHEHRNPERQQFIREVVASLHHAAGDADNDCARVFGGVAQLVTWHITKEPASTSEEFQDVISRIRTFIGSDDEAERDLLLGMLLKELAENIQTFSAKAYEERRLREHAE